MKRPRSTVAGRLRLILCGLAACSTALALGLQQRALAADLERAASRRLERAAAAADQLIESHLRTLADRYTAISNTPELRANLEVKHAPTLTFHATRLAGQQRAALLAFADRSGKPSALVGGRALLEPARKALGPRGRALFAHGGGLFAAAEVPLETRGRPVGSLVAVEPIGEELLAGWSELCGARLAVTPASDAAAPGLGLDRVLRPLGAVELRVIASLDEERQALANARHNQLAAGAVALALAFAASGLLAQGLVRPIRRIQDATERIARGDLATRLRLARRDEIGDVARGFDLMLDRLEHAMGRLRESESRLAGAQRRARLGNWTLDPESGELHGSEELRRVLDVPADAVLDRALLFGRVHPEDRERFAAALEACIAAGAGFEFDHRTAGEPGAQRILHAQGERVVRGDGGLRVEGTLQDVTDRKRIEEQIRYLAYHDSVTSLGNRRLFQERLELALDEARRAGSSLAVLLLDLDGFRTINDTLGHSAGDRLLKGVAERLLAGLRAGPERAASNGPDAPLVARFGGDEFAILLGAVRGPEEAARAARRVLRALAEPFHLDGHEVSVTASIGITTSPPDGDDAETLLRNADTALVHAKEQGRNHQLFFAEAMNALVFERLVLETRLRRAIERGELELHYQAKVRLEDGRVAGVEALARWSDPELGFVSPAIFIPLAEEAGLIRAIGDWALRTAVRQIAEWDAACAPRVCVSVNVSGHHLGGGSLLATLVPALEHSQVTADRVELEITETALLRDEAAAMPLLEELRRMGVRIALDDFGTGYSSLSHLLRIPADTLKIDRSFLHRIDTDPADAALVGSIIAMAKIRGLRVVAEGVESEEQLAVLRELGCDDIQGHLFGAAVPATELPRLIAEIEARREKPEAEEAPPRRGRAPARRGLQRPGRGG